MSRILITGASGFIGSALYQALKDQYEITALSSSNNGEGYTNINLLDTNACKDFFKDKKFDIIIHAAAIAHGVNKINDLRVDQANILMTKNIFNFLDVSQSKIIFLSSVAVYSYKNKGEYISVVDTPYPVSAYGKSKLECEKIIVSTNPSSYSILRICPVFTRDNLVDVKKRIILPVFKKPFLTIQERKYSLVERSNVIYQVMEQINLRENTLRIVCDNENYSQNEILKWFDIKEQEVLYINQKWIGLFQSILNLFPFNQIRHVQDMIHKLFYSVVYNNGK